MVFQLQNHFPAFPKFRAGISQILSSYSGTEPAPAFSPCMDAGSADWELNPHIPLALQENHKDRTLWNKKGGEKANTFQTEPYQGLGQTRALF